MEIRKESNVAHIFVIGIILGATILYFPPYAWAWVGDDYVQFDYVLEFLKRPLSSIQLLNPYFLPWYYRPTQNFWFLGNRAVFGLNPVAFYWQMVLWHSLAIALVYRVLRQFRIRPFSAMLATALFAIHGHYVDVVGWNSSVAIVMAAVFSLASLSSYLNFLTAKDAKSAKKNLFLFKSFIFFLLAMLSHEEAILLPVFLLVLTFVKGRKQKAEGRKIRFTKPQILMLVGMLGVTAVSIIIQFSRPNLTIDLSETPAAQWWSLVSPTQIGQFVKDMTLRYTLTANLDAAQEAAPLLLAIVILLLMGAWFLMGNWIVRLGLIWVGLHVALIYATLWQSKPELLAGRHFYQASFGLALAIGASIDQLRQVESPQFTMGKRQISLVMAVIVGLVTAVLINHIISTQTTQKKWLARAETDQAAKVQMQTILPELTSNTRVFANRFPITPAFFRSVTEIWYEQDSAIPQPTGTFAQLQDYGKATDDFYVFDYDDGKLYNLMPELQSAPETVFIWSQEPRIDVVEPDGDITEINSKRGKQDFAVLDEENRRFSVSLAPIEIVNGWLSLAYVIPEIPTESDLHLGFRTDVATGALIRVRLDPVGSNPVTILEGKATTEWVDITEPMDQFLRQPMVVRLETAVAPGGTVYWGNPRFVLED